MVTRTKRNPSGPLPPEPRVIPETVEEEHEDGGASNNAFIFDSTDPVGINQAILIIQGDTEEL